MCVYAFQNFNSLYKTPRAFALEKRCSLSLSHSHTQRAAHDDDLSLCSFFLARVFVCVYVSARYVCSMAGKILCGRLFLTLFYWRKNSREQGCLFGEKRRGKKKHEKEEVVLDVFSLVALTSGLQLVE